MKLIESHGTVPGQGYLCRIASARQGPDTNRAMLGNAAHGAMLPAVVSFFQHDRMEAVIQMAMIERERGLDATAPGRFALPFRISRIELEEPATLILPDGRSVAADAAVSLCRSAFFLSGRGQFRCMADVGLDATTAGGWPALRFKSGTQVSIEVYDLKAFGDGYCRCLFEVTA